jgi:hypothetical protein
VTTIWTGAIFVALALLAAGNRRATGLVIAGGLLYLLGLASIVPELDALATLPPSFLAVSAGFIWVGVAGAKWGLFVALLHKEELAIAKLGRAVIPLVVAIGTIALLSLLYVTHELLLAGGWQGLVVAIGLAGAGVFLLTLLGIARIGRGWRWLDTRWLTRWSEGTPSLLSRSALVSGIGADLLFVAGVVVPHFAVAAVAMVAGTFLAHDALRPSGKVPRWGLQPFIVLASLLASTWFIWTIAGPDLPLTIEGLREAPFSAAAEMSLAPMLALAAWAFLGLWPFHGTGPGSALSIVGGALLIRWGMGVIPTGIAHLAPLAGIVALLAVFHATALRRSGEYAAALGILAVTASGAAAWPLFALGSLPATLWILGRRSPVPGLDRHELTGVLLLPAIGWALPTMLRGETVLTVIAVISGAVLYISDSRPASP